MKFQNDSDAGGAVPQFGEQKANREYRHRSSVYAIAYDHQGDLLVARSQDRLILPGGGIDGEETAEQALHREVLEETGWQIKNLRLVCRANEYTISRSRDRATNKIAQFFLVEATGRVQEPTEEDHKPLWIPRTEAIKKLHREFFRWAVARTDPS